MNRHPLTPALVILIMSSLGLGLILMAQILTRPDLYFVNKFGLGLDYRDFYTASLMVRTGESPYAVVRYVTPPLGAIINVPLTYLPLDRVGYAVSLAIFPAVLGAVFLVHRALTRQRPWDDLVFMTVVAVVVMLSYPFYFLMDRVNIDGFVLLVMCLGIFALGRADAVAGVLFAVAVGLKAYPILVVLPLAAKRRWTPLVFMAIALAIFVLLTPDQWWRFVQSRLMTRGQAFRIDENGSLANTLFYLGGFVTFHAPTSASPFAELLERLGLPLYLVLLSAVAVRDVMTGATAGPAELRSSVVLYFPFMVAVPQLAYHYELVNLLALIPVVTWGWLQASSAADRRALAVMTVGIGLSQFHAVAAEKVVGSVYPHFVPGLGLLVVLLGIVVAKWRDVFHVRDVRAA